MKNILLHIHDDDGQADRLAVALDLAQQTGAHLSCVQVSPNEAYGADPLGNMFGLAAVIDTLHDQDKALRLGIEAQLARSGVPWDWRHQDGHVVENLIEQAMLADLVIVSQPLAVRRGAREPLPIVGDVVMYTRCPLLMVPQGVGGLALDGPALVAWNGSPEAAHALRTALPLLRRASAVHIVEVSDDHPGIAARAAAQYLSRHGLAVDVHEWPAKGRRISVALLHAAAELSARTLVMGAYGHSRLRETVLGGVTRDLITTATLPLLLAH
ncbi:MAG: universal stress protein [Sphingomonadales bacterium]|jgi:nucleotide-binding universal stress UspA family protein